MCLSGPMTLTLTAETQKRQSQQQRAFEVHVSSYNEMNVILLFQGIMAIHTNLI